MAENYTSNIKAICKVYTQDEAASMLGVSVKSIQNYLSGERPGKKSIGKIQELYNKLLSNKWERLPQENSKTGKKEVSITADAVLLKVLLQEFADYKAQKEGVNADDVISDIENKARLILKVASKV